MKRRLEKVIEDINFGLSLQCNGCTLRYGSPGSMAYNCAVRNRNALVEINKILDECFV